MHVNRLKTGADKRRRHFNLTVHPLLPQNSDLGFDIEMDKRRANIIIRVKRELSVQTRISNVEQTLEFLLGTV